VASTLEAIRGDIVEQVVDAIVNAANSSLLGGGGVDGAIHRVGGPQILAECRALRAGRFEQGLPAGEAVATTAGRLPARHVIHTVGPVYSSRADRSEILKSAYRRSIEVAAELGARSVAFPAISAGSMVGLPRAPQPSLSRVSGMRLRLRTELSEPSASYCSRPKCFRSSKPRSLAERNPQSRVGRRVSTHC